MSENSHSTPRFVYLLSRARHQLMRELDRETLERVGISATQLGALFALRGMDGCLLKDLSEALGLDNSAITGMVARMVKAGVIEKRRCPLDGRAFRVHLTDRGRAVAGQGLGALAEINARLTDGFSDDELQIAARFLTAVIERFSPK